MYHRACSLRFALYQLEHLPFALAARLQQLLDQGGDAGQRAAEPVDDLGGDLAHCGQTLAVGGDLHDALAVRKVPHDRHGGGTGLFADPVLAHRDFGREIVAIDAPGVQHQGPGVAEDFGRGAAGGPVAVEVNQLLHVSRLKLERAGGEDLGGGRVGVGDVALCVDDQHGVAQHLEFSSQAPQGS